MAHESFEHITGDENYHTIQVRIKDVYVRANYLNSSTCLLFWQRREPQIRPNDFELGVFLFRLLCLDAWVYDYIVTRHPIDRGRDLVFISSLQ